MSKIITTQEAHNVEWKNSWHDEYFKWVCGYANAYGGNLFIGVNDDGYVVGLRDSRKLLEDLPNRIRDKLGIIASVLYHHASKRGENIRYGEDIPKDISSKKKNLYACGLLTANTDKERKSLKMLEENEPVYVNSDGTLDYIEIVVEAYPHIVSYDGVVYRRTGSTLQTLNGIELEKFILSRSGNTWDNVGIPQVKVSDLDKDALNAFRAKSISNGRRTENQVEVSDETLLDDLKCYDKDGNIKRAAVLFFHKDPEKFVTGAYIKIGYFGERYGNNDVGDVVFQDAAHGPLLLQIDKIIEFLYSKYLKALISYKGTTRIETFLWPREALREVILNAINNKDYSSGNPIQIRVYDDHISVFNEGHWPVERLKVEDVYKEHSSYAANPELAKLFYASGDIEAWGSGFSKIKENCEKDDAPLPIIDIGDKDTPLKGVTVRCDGCKLYMQRLNGESKYDTRRNDGLSFGSLNELCIFIDDAVAAKKISKTKRNAAQPIIEYIWAHDEITTTEGISITGKTRPTVLGYLESLEKIGLIEATGQTNNAKYTIRFSRAN